MEQPASNETASHDQEASIGRRQLLKVLATSGMVAASTRLPTHWTTPLAEGGKLPAHAQVSNAPRYSGVCDSDPGGGDLVVTEGSIRNIQPYLQVLSGTGTVQGIATTMSVETTTPLTLTFNPTLPQSVATNSSGRASFPDLAVTGAPGNRFFLVFDFATPSGSVQVRCGEFFFS